SLLDKKKQIHVVFAAAPSQLETLASLIKDHRVAWNRIHAFHMDEYIGFIPQSFGLFLRKNIFDLVPFGSVSYINASAGNPHEECQRYARLLEQGIDLVVMGIGENCHIAFNDPPVADF